MTAQDFEHWFDEIDKKAADEPETLGIQAFLELLEGMKGLVGRVQSIHQPVEAVNYRGGMPRRTQVCSGCGTDDGNWQQYPCPTIRALNGAK
jgi:hypothetical protein